MTQFVVHIIASMVLMFIHVSHPPMVVHSKEVQAHVHFLRPHCGAQTTIQQSPTYSLQFHTTLRQ